MPKYIARFTREVRTLEHVERVIEAATPEIAAMRANADALEFEHVAPTDVATGDTHTTDWRRSGSMEELEP